MWGGFVFWSPEFPRHKPSIPHEANPLAGKLPSQRIVSAGP
ncbi:hypothetical protein THTE_1020 [Thermogutta terrifontis]|uniref:Uncharacterized protein n=1 Tax=Thermogutta terrifontis TaxID=1331910 RepID=A0A286RCC8_9BACT|nr:hypothetical protein THTE_1020 [Thermogutta terrifontis]